MTRCGEDVTDEYAENTFHWTRDSGDMEADTTWNTAHAGMKSITFAVADIDGDVKISCTLTANGATYGSIAVDGNMDASHTPAELDANDVFVIENGNLKVTTSRGNAYVLENGTLKAAGAKLNGSITAQTKLFASQPEDMVEFSYDHNGLRTQKKVTRADGIVETTDYVLHGKLLTHLTRGSDSLHFFYDEEKRPTMVEFNGTLYGYVHNLQGDIVGIIDSAGNLVVEYGYDAWGKPVVVRTLTTAYDVLAELNPFRYRGYIWDKEFHLYYLVSRYYNPGNVRIVNSDGAEYAEKGMMINNLFAYCANSPIINIDTDGNIFGGLIAAIGNVVSTVVTAVASAAASSILPIVIIGAAVVVVGALAIDHWNQTRTMRKLSEKMAEDVVITANTRAEDLARDELHKNPQYWLASRTSKVVIAQKPLSYTEAVEMAYSGHDILAINENAARAIAGTHRKCIKDNAHKKGGQLHFAALSYCSLPIGCAFFLSSLTLR